MKRTSVEKHWGGNALTLLLFIAGLTVLNVGCGKSTPAGANAPNTSTTGGGQTAPEQMLESWKSDTNAAVEKFLATDWSQRPLFSAANVLGYTEAQFVDIPAADRNAKSKQLADELQAMKLICVQVNRKGKDALASGDRATAEKCFNQLKECGDALNGPDALSLMKMVGKAVNKMATNDLAALNQ